MTEVVDTLPPWALWAVFAAAAALLVALLVLLAARRRRAQSTAGQLASISHEMLTDIIVPKADDGEIQIGYALLTGRGVLVVETKEVAGVVFASDRMDDWTVMAGDRRYTFANPQPTLYDRIAAVAQVLGDVPVDGVVFASDRMDDWTVMAGDRRYTFANPQPTLYDRIAAVAQVLGDVPVDGVVVFPDAADFSKGRPRHVTTLDGLLADYPRVDRNRDCSEVAAFMPYWDRLRQEAVSARVGRLAD